MPAKTRIGESFLRVIGFTAGHWRRHPALAGGIIALMLGFTVADLLLPIYAGRLVDAISLPDRAAGREIAISAVTSMAFIGLAMVGLRHFAFLGIVRLTLAMMRDMAQEAFWRVQRFATDWHANTFSGSTVRRITRGMWAVDLLNDTIIQALIPSVAVLVGATVLLGLRWPIMGLVIGASAIIFLGMATAFTLFYVAPAARLSNRWDTRVGAVLADAIGCNPVVKGFSGEQREDEILSHTLGKWRNRVARSWTRGTNSSSIQLLALLLLRTAVLGMAVALWWDGQASAGDVTYVLTTYFVVHGYLRDIGHNIANVQRSVNDMEDLVAMHQDPIGVADRPSARPLAITQGGIKFDNVTFRYGGHITPLFNQLSVTIAPGARVGLVGHSGSGKSTFVKLLQRLYDINDGEIRIDSTNIATATQKSLRAQIAIVAQEPILFHRSLAENIAYSRPTASLAEIQHAATLANAHTFITNLPKGYNTLVGERGVKLSGGERQRIALARAFLANAPILILDEATSSLDSASETLIQQATERLMKGRTAIIIAHRLSTVRNLDRILVFNHGNITEDGNHKTLLRNPHGHYRQLFEQQASGLETVLENGVG